MTNYVGMKDYHITALVAGGAGFIGSHLCRQLIADGKEVICLDNLHTGRIDNVKALVGHPLFHFLQHDIITPFISSQPIDEIYNLACPASPIHYQSDPIQTTKTCFMGTLNLLELARVHGCPMLQASTSEVYGDATIHPQPESYRGNVNPIGLRACYDEGKRCAESLCMDYHRQTGVKVKLIRIFNTYGPNMAVDDGRVISNFIVQALRGKDITIYGDGSQTRSFMYIDDLIRGIRLMMETEDKFTGPVNLGNPDEQSVLSMAEMVVKLTDGHSMLTYRKLPSDDPKKRKPDISLAKRKLKWEPVIPLEYGLRQTIRYFRNKLTSN